MTLQTGLAGTAVVALAAAAAMMGGGQRLQTPFPQAEAQAAGQLGPGTGACPAPLPAVRDIQSESKYGANRQANDSTVVDPAAAAKYAQDTQPVVDFSHQVSRFADGVAKQRHDAPQDAQCAIAWLDSWARQGALLGAMSDNGEAVRKWELATLASAYLKVRAAPHDSAADARIRQWLRQVATAVRADYSRGIDRDSRNNNHLYWAAWAVMVSAIASDDRGLFDWSIGRLHYALGQIQADGTLPLELKRRHLALSYHAFAAGPLIMLREGALDNGVTLSDQETRRLQALIDRVIGGLADPRYMSGKAGEDQDLDKVTNTQLAWLEPYYAHSHDPRALPLITARRPLSAPRLGGDMTALFAPSGT